MWGQPLSWLNWNLEKLVLWIRREENRRTTEKNPRSNTRANNKLDPLKTPAWIELANLQYAIKSTAQVQFHGNSLSVKKNIVPVDYKEQM